MVNDLLEGLTAPCGKCRGSQYPSGWSPVWGMYLCSPCRLSLTDSELKKPAELAAVSLPADPPLVV